MLLRCKQRRRRILLPARPADPAQGPGRGGGRLHRHRPRRQVFDHDPRRKAGGGRRARRRPARRLYARRARRPDERDGRRRPRVVARGAAAGQLYKRDARLRPDRRARRGRLPRRRLDIRGARRRPRPRARPRARPAARCGRMAAAPAAAPPVVVVRPERLGDQAGHLQVPAVQRLARGRGVSRNDPQGVRPARNRLRVRRGGPRAPRPRLGLHRVRHGARPRRRLRLGRGVRRVPGRVGRRLAGRPVLRDGPARRLRGQAVPPRGGPGLLF